jgi:hypothetical protein
MVYVQNDHQENEKLLIKRQKRSKLDDVAAIWPQSGLRTITISLSLAADLVLGLLPVDLAPILLASCRRWPAAAAHVLLDANGVADTNLVHIVDGVDPPSIVLLAHGRHLAGNG